MEEVGNILRILRETKNFVEKDSSRDLKILSNQTIHSATISQDPDNVIVAVLVYALGKVLERDNYQLMEGWKPFYEAVLKNLTLAIKSLEKNDTESCRVYLGKIRNSLNAFSTNLNDYIKDVFRRAEVNKAFKIYEHGLSSEKTAKILGVSLWDLASYIGRSHISDSKIAVSMPIKKRIKIAEDFFR